MKNRYHIRLAERVFCSLFSLFSLSLVLSLTPPLSAQDLTNFEQEILIQQGIAAFEVRAFPEALEIFSRIQEEAQDINPKVEYWLGRIFEVEGEFPLASEKYERALNGTRVWNQRDLEIEILYHRANFYYVRGEYDKFLQDVESVIALEEPPTDNTMSLERILLSNLSERGLFATLYLMQKKLTFSIKAYSELANYYLQQLSLFERQEELTDEEKRLSEEYRLSALRNASLAVVGELSDLTEIIRKKEIDFFLPGDREELWGIDPEFVLNQVLTRGDELGILLPIKRDLTQLESPVTYEQILEALAMINREDPSFDITNLDYLFSYIYRDPILIEYIDNEEIMKGLYELAESFFYSQNPQRAQEIWGLVVRLDRKRIWAKRSRRKLEEI